MQKPIIAKGNQPIEYFPKGIVRVKNCVTVFGNLKSPVNSDNVVKASKMAGMAVKAIVV